MILKKASINNSPKVKTSYYAGIFLIALSTLLLEYTMTRVMSVALWHHFAFLIISIALLGFGISGVFVSVNKKISSYDTDRLLTILSIIFGVSVIFSFILINKIPFDPFSLLNDPIQFLYLPLFYLLITIPFFFSGIIISLLLSKFKHEISKLYFFDLTGAGFACLAFIILMPAAGGNGSIVFIAVFGFLAAIVFGFEKYKSLSLAAFILAGLSMTFLIDSDNRFPINVTTNKIYGNYIKSRPDLKIRTDWNTFSRVDVMKEEEKSPDGYDIMLAIIDAGNATTNIPNVKSFPLERKPADASNLAFKLKDSADKVFIIGSAGGGEILTGLYHNAKSITAVEINGILNNLINDDLNFWTGPLVKDNKRVKLITDDARSVLSSKRILYDVIISAHTISSSAVSSGAMSMVENYILTKEAVKEYLKHLEKDGVLYITRPENQIPKLIKTIKAARLEISGGLDSSKNKFIIFRRPPGSFEGDRSFLAGVLYKKDGFTQEQILNIRDESSSLGLDLLYDPISKTESPLKTFIESGINTIMTEFPESSVKPATDDKPFFDQNIGFGNLSLESIKETFSQDDRAILALKDKPVAETMLIAILIQCILIAGIFILLPIKIFSKEKTGDKKGDEYSMDKKFLIYFCCLGFGYILLQICMIQKFTLFLGQPSVTLLTVVSTMLVSSGIGSLVSAKVFGNNPKRLYLIFGIIVTLVLLIGMFNEYFYESFVRMNPALRVAVSVMIIFPLGFFMGMPFPLGISMILPEEKRFAAFAWGVNGFFSVIGTVVAVIFAMMYGFKFVFILGAFIYIIAMLIIQNRYKKSYSVKIN
ncbi:MAG: hypothetical protein HGGPFJEG_02723 [Ignavibacteria bacterium]|nr:hypothetical protein [Ignavibacteria bacterium]